MDMGRIEKKITDKYLESDHEKYHRYMKAYWKAKRVVKFIPNVVINTYLCARFPFLKFNAKSGFFQKTSWYWQIDKGWRKAFGIQLCKELKAALKRGGILRTYEITTVKEKFGSLNIYDNGATAEVHDIINKYEYISSRTCIECGRPAKYRTRGWVEPYCEDCFQKIDTTIAPDEYYKDFDWYGWKK